MKKLKYKIFVFLLISSNLLIAQISVDKKAEIDSLNRIIKEAVHDTAIAKAYHELSGLYSVSNLDTMLVLDLKAKVLAEVNLKKELSENVKNNFLKTKAGSLNNMAYVYEKYGDVDKAISFYSESLKISEEINDNYGQALVLNNLGVMYNRQEDTVQALIKYRKAYSLFQAAGDKIGESSTLGNIGAIFRSQKKIDLALNYFNKSLAIREKINFKKGISNSLSNIGEVYYYKGNYEEAIVYYNKALKIRKEIGFKLGISSTLLHMAYASMELHKVPEAKNYAMEALKIAQDAGLVRYIDHAALCLSKLNKKEGNYKEALTMFELHTSMKDSVIKLNNQKAIYKQSLQYEYEKKKALDDVKNQKDIELVEEQQKRQELVSRIAFGGLILMTFFGLIFYKRWKLTKKQKGLIEIQKEELNRKNNEKIAMLKEIHHRVKNNLQVVNTLLKLQSKEIEDENIVAMFTEAQNRVVSMALLHEKMYRSDDLQYIDLQDHISLLVEDLLKTYVVRKNITSDIKIANIAVGIRTLVPLGLIINEIITNSLKYAFEGKEAGKVIIDLKKLKNENFEMIIGDDGIGINKEVKNGGLGAKLIQTFIKQLKGTIEKLEQPGTVFKIVFEKID